MNGHHPDHPEEHAEHTAPVPKSLLHDATVTIFFDGLIYTAYNEEKKLYQAAVHTDAEEHELKVEVTLRGTAQPLFPTDQLPWDPTLSEIKKNAPFSLYVGSGGDLKPEEASAKLFLPAAADERSFDRILNFQDLYEGRKITLNTARFAEFNFPHGTCYSALNTIAKLSKLAPNNEPTSEGEINVSTLGAIDINLVSDEKVAREIVLVNKDGKRFFNFPLEAGKHYDIKVFNQPMKTHVHAGDPERHFLQYYELFPLKEKEQRFLVEPAQGHGPGTDPGSPPCIQGGGDRKGGLP